MNSNSNELILGVINIFDEYIVITINGISEKREKCDGVISRAIQGITESQK